MIHRYTQTICLKSTDPIALCQYRDRRILRVCGKSIPITRWRYVSPAFIQRWLDAKAGAD